MSSIDPIRAPRARRGRGARYLLVFLILLFAGTALWTWLTLQWAYSDGTRSGVIQKFSRRGWLCKTQEGELALYAGGLSPQIWRFSVRDAGVGAEIEKDVGARVQVHYTEHPGVPSTCFADTRYFVDRVTVTDPLPPLTAPVPALGIPSQPVAPPATAPAATAPAAATPATPQAAPAHPAPAQPAPPPAGAVPPQG
jgi:hypothetical protein